MVRIRLKRMGRRNYAFFRLCVMDAREERDGRSIEDIGYYDPHKEKFEEKFVFKRDRVEYWLSVGAQPTEKVRILLKKAGVEIPSKSRRKKKKKKEKQSANNTE